MWEEFNYKLSILLYLRIVSEILVKATPKIIIENNIPADITNEVAFLYV